MKKVIILISVSLLVLLFIGWNNSLRKNVDIEVDQFSIYLIEGRHIDELPYDYTDERWSKFIEDAELTNVLVSDTDIESYNWNNQLITLTKEASDSISGILSENRFSLIERNFVVALDQTKYYAGSIIEASSARAIDYPVIYIVESDDRVTLEIRPSHSVMSPDYQISENDSINKQDLREYFNQIHKLTNY
jgi:hypothetical protein